MKHACSWNIQIYCPSVEMSSLGLRPRDDMSASGQHIKCSTCNRASFVYCGSRRLFTIGAYGQNENQRDWQLMVPYAMATCHSLRRCYIWSSSPGGNTSRQQCCAALLLAICVKSAIKSQPTSLAMMKSHICCYVFSLVHRRCSVYIT